MDKKTNKQMKNELRNFLDLQEKQKNEMQIFENNIEKTKEELKRENKKKM